MIQTITNKQEWKKCINTFPHHDFYHTYSYHELSKKQEEQPILFSYEDANGLVALPLLIRNIKGTNYKDATSVYGYAGPLVYKFKTEYDNSKFKIEFQKFLISENIVSIFSRLHPFIEYQDQVLKGLGEISNPGSLVNIDLKKPIEEQRACYGSRLKTYLNKARKSCSVYLGSTEEDIQEFISIYHENMDRVGANEGYFFDERYFYRLLLSSEYETELLLCKSNETDEIIAGAIFILTDDIVQYHLSGAKTEYLDLGGIKLIIDEMRLRANEMGFKYFNLGGGRANREDSLLSFKSSFSKDLVPFKLWKYIVNQEIYDYLIEKELKRVSSSITDEELEFFPAYRIIPKKNSLTNG
ncbi:peptidoglycan bridge formation glycyltransferase FemA/FemB family protein [Cytophaga sp. FL35]|uniref:peptidoglycan bridge formation glycyltransferase FemA/FemB family protein n=1 Tax=Cytophaga sp. FL35 TaxID=1904456 RepID=UPI001653D95D|nr:peptidoglycan bridge formation glycyltransferase FemA/FemB family protein [Cytophaga sp. FL35]MBC6997200.1 peptidoglycan bridge formation glycyltransferase FemA/FemB family protein [Cytophaga sp. FL35]